MTRQSDISSDDPAQVELGHVYAKLQTLESEQKEIKNGLHEVQLELARGRRFPVGLYGVVVTLIVTVLGSAFVLYSELKLNTAAVSEWPELRERLTSAFNGMRAAEMTRAAMLEEQTRLRTTLDSMSQDCCHQVPVLSERIKSLEGRIVGQGPQGWHRADHDLYAQTVDARFATIDARMKALEDKRK